MRLYDAYLFDWDGTLARTAEIWLEEIKRALAGEGVAVSDVENARHLGNFGWFQELGLPEPVVEALEERIVAAAYRRFSAVSLYDTAADLLSALHSSGKKIGLVTTTRPNTLDVVMDRHNIRALFDVIVTGQDVRHTKPDPEGILLALDRLHVQPARAIMLGDTHNDILAARNAGIDSALFYPASHQLLYDLAELQRHGPTHMVRHWQELVDQVQSEA